MDVFQQFYYQLVTTLPLDDATFVAKLYSRNLLPGDLKDQVNAKLTVADKATHFLDHGIKPFLNKHDKKQLQDLLSVMNESGISGIIQLAKEITDELSLSPENPSKCLKHTDDTNGLTVLAERYSKHYEATRFKNKLTDQPYALNLKKTYIPLTFIQCKSRQRQEQLSTMAKEHQQLLNFCDINNYCCVPDRHLPLSLKLNNVHNSNDNAGTNKIEDLFVMADGQGRAKSILIEGPPGIGKTELVKEIAFRWAKKKFLADIKLVILLKLRDPKVLAINSIKMLTDFFVNENLIDDDIAKHVSKQLQDSQGDKILFLLDGFDEYYDKLQEDGFLACLIDCSVLPSSTVFITSRPSGSCCLHNQVDCIFEIHGFDKEAQNLFISHSLGSLDREKAFKAFLCTNPIVKSYCYIPLYLTMFTFLFKQAKDTCLPHTLTEITEQFILGTVFLYMKLDTHKRPRKLQRLNDLPMHKEAFEIICQLSEIAFTGIMSNKLVFTLDEIEKTCPTIGNEVNGFGLLQAVEHYSEILLVGREVSFNFIHYIMQEFLAAYHISRLPDEKQYELMEAGHQENHFCSDFVEGVPYTLRMSGSSSLWNSQFASMWLMYVGLTGGESVAFKKFVHGTESKDDGQLLLLFQYYSETKNDMMYQYLLEIFDVDNVIIIGSDINGMHSFALLPHHMMSLVLLLSRSKSAKSLKVSNTVIPLDSFNILGNYFENVNSNINCLHLRKNYLQPSGAKTIGNIIKKNCLETLEITDNFLRHGSIEEFSAALSLSHSIHFLTLSKARLRSDDICRLMEAVVGKDIQYLDISENYFGSKGANSVTVFVHTNRALQSLDVSCSAMAFSDQGIQCCLGATVLQNCGIIPENIFDDYEGIKEFFNALKNHPNITSLHLSNILFLESVYYQLVFAFPQSRMLLQLYWDKLDDAFRTILELTIFNRSLVTLNISDNGFGDYLVYKWFNALRYSTSLKFLDISDNRLQTASAKIISEVLQVNCTLTCLALGSNNIGDEGCKYLAEALLANKTLTSLYIRDNMIFDDGASKIATALTRNTTLLYLDLSFNEIGDNGTIALVNALQVNNSLKVLFVMINPISDEKAGECLSRNSDIYVTFPSGIYFTIESNMIYVHSAQYMACNTCVVFTQQKYHGRLKNEPGAEIFLRYAYNSYIPNDEKDCLKYYIEKLSSWGGYHSLRAFVPLIQV